jgi:hypothetical protein
VITDHDCLSGYDVNKLFRYLEGTRHIVPTDKVCLTSMIWTKFSRLELGMLTLVGTTVMMARPYAASQIRPKLKKPGSRGLANPKDFWMMGVEASQARASLDCAR